MPKNKRNVVSTYSETKVKVGLSLTPTGANRLMAIAEKLGISRSELLERIARGDLVKSSEGIELTFSLQNGSQAPKQVAVLEGEETENEIDDGATTVSQSQDLPVDKPNELLESYEALQKQSQEQISAIAALQVQLAQLQHLEQQVEQTVPTESYEALQKQSQEQISAIAALQVQLAQLQHLEQQVEQTVPTESYEALQKQSQEQISAIAALQVQLAQLQHLESEVPDSISRASYEVLHCQCQEQADTIKTLQEQIAQLRTVAGIGEIQLNKWRNRTFSR